MFEYSPDPPPLDITVALMLPVWFVLMLPWIFVSGFIGRGLLIREALSLATPPQALASFPILFCWESHSITEEENQI